MSINVWRVAGNTLNITCNFLYCNYQVYKYFVITLYINIRRLEILVRLITVKARYNVTSFIAHTTLWTENTYFKLSRFIAANCSEQCIFWTHLFWCATLLIKLTLVAEQSSISSQSLDSNSKKYQGRLSTNCIKRNIWHSCGKWNVLIVTDGNFMNWYIYSFSHKTGQ